MPSFKPATSARVFRDRVEAGKVLARSLSHYAADSNVVVLGLARGGVPVARQVADALDAPLGVMVARKIGLPGIEEVALGAIVEGSRRIVLHAIAQQIGVPARLIERLAAMERVELERCAALYHSAWPLPELRERVVLLVDDGVATGVTLRAAVRAVRRARPTRIAAAVAVASRWGYEAVRADVDELIVASMPDKFERVSAAYEDRNAITDEDVLEVLGRRTRRTSPNVLDFSERRGTTWPGTAGPRMLPEQTVRIAAAGGVVAADLGMPLRGMVSGYAQRSGDVRGLIIFAHAAGSSRHSFATRYLAGRLRLAGYATLRLDLLTKEERQTVPGGPLPALDVARLASRLADACGWAAREGLPGSQHTTLVGTGTGATAAFVTAGRHPTRVRAVIGRGGRIDLATPALSSVRVPVLLIVGAADQTVGGRDVDLLPMLPESADVVRVPRAPRALDDPDVVGFIAEPMVGWVERLDRTERRNIRYRSRQPDP